MTIILAIWAAAAVAGAVTAVVCFKKRRRPEAICDTCSHLKCRQDHTNPRDGTYWVCDKEGRFSDPPEFCRAWHERTPGQQERLEKIVPLLIQEHGDGHVILPMDSQVMNNASIERLINEGAYANLQTMASEWVVTPEAPERPLYANKLI